MGKQDPTTRGRPMSHPSSWIPSPMIGMNTILASLYWRLRLFHQSLQAIVSKNGNFRFHIDNSTHILEDTRRKDFAIAVL